MENQKPIIKPINDISLLDAVSALEAHEMFNPDSLFMQLCATIAARAAEENDRTKIQNAINRLSALLAEGGHYHQKGNSSFHIFMLREKLKDLLKNGAL